MEIETMRKLMTAAVLIVALVATAGGDDTKKDVEKLQGKWELTSSEKDGKKMPTGSMREVKGDKYTITAKGKVLGKGTIKLDATARPKAIDATRDGDKTMLGIYAIDGDEQKVCLAPAGKP